MSLFFFLSGLFVWPSIERKGTGRFLHGRMLRLGLPFALVSAFLMPLALYPTYLQTAADPSVAAYGQHWLALPFWPGGPMWFLWLLLVADFAAAGLHRLAPRMGRVLSRISSAVATNPAKFAVVFLIASAVAYVPMALVFSPSAWFNRGPFAFQLSRPLHYALYFFAGVAIGANSIERGLLVTNGPLARHWPVGLTAALASLLFWMGITGVTMADGVTPSLGLQILADLSFVLACFASCFAVLAIVLRFAAKSLPKLAGLRNSAYGMYLIHYLFVVWLQYALLKAALPATIKGGVVFTGTLLLSWGVIAALRRVPPVAQIIGADRARGVPAS
jgi:hypothetical protein